jgi:hypothetical protein
MESRFLAKPAKVPFTEATSALTRYACPVRMAVSEAAMARPSSES